MAAEETPQRRTSWALGRPSISSRPSTTGVELVVEEVRQHSFEHSVFPTSSEVVETSKGPVTVTVFGDRTRPAVVTYHDVGLTYESCFQPLFNAMGTDSVLSMLCVFNITAPYQENGAVVLNPTDPFPTFDELVEQVEEIRNHFLLRSFFGFGVGAGANVLLHYALKYPDTVRGLICSGVNARAGTGWIKWIGDMMHYYVGSVVNPTTWEKIREQLIYRYFSPTTLETHLDLCQQYRALLDSRNHVHVTKFLDADSTRPDITLRLKELKCKILCINGRDSPQFDDTLFTISNCDMRLEHVNLEILECGMLAPVEHIDKVMDPIALFFAGYGIFLVVPTPRSERSSISTPAPGAPLVGGPLSPPQEEPAVVFRAQLGDDPTVPD